MGNVHGAAGRASTCASNRSPTWALIFAVSVCTAACGQPPTNTSQAVNASVAPAPSPEANATAVASNAVANTNSAVNTAATDPGTSDSFPPAPATPPFSERFKTYPITVFQGPVVYPDFAGAQKPYADYRTRLTDGVKGGVNFAGHYSLVQFGCGTGCNTGYMVDVTNGQVAPLPLGNLANTGIEYASRPDSAMLQTVWRSDMLTDANGNRLNSDPTPTCVFENLLWQGGKFKVLDQNKTATLCP